ncbi:MAG: sialate O-acetylesterase, partial [Verrucomicrobiales bacterium]|nr:sialate O-acetylesterase [Verrucomicrobiales bacterium]
MIGVGYATLEAQAELRLAGVFSSHAVLQRGRPLPVWGWGDEGATVKVTFCGRAVETRVVGGKWRVELPAQRAGGPYEMEVRSGAESVTLSDVLVGEVWVASGQSNMEWPLTRSENPQAAIASSANPRIRLYTVPKRKAEAPIDDIKAQWQLCGPETVGGFSAVAYFFGRDLGKELGVPIGLIHTSWGGSPAEAWTSEPALSASEELKKDILD